MKVFSPALNFRLLLLAVTLVWIALGAPTTSSMEFNMLVAGVILQAVAVKVRHVLEFGAKAWLLLLAVSTSLAFGAPLANASWAEGKVVFLSWAAIGYALAGLMVVVLRNSLWAGRPAKS